MIRLPVDYNFLDQKSLEDLPLIEIKYKQIKSSDHLMMFSESLPTCLRNVIICMLNYSSDYFSLYDKCYLDVKVRELKSRDTGDYLNKWHYDWVKDYNHPIKHEKHLIYTNKFGTHYIENGVEKQCLDNSIYMYGRELHKSPTVAEDIKRVMIRLSFVDNQF